MLLIAVPGLWFFRKKLLFIVHHNVQWAHVHLLERMFKLLIHFGFQFGFLESAAGLRELGVAYREQQFVTVPLPGYPQVRRVAKEASRELPLVGVIGRELPGKNTNLLLDLLLDLKKRDLLAADLLLGSDDLQLLQRWEDRGVTAVRTTDYQDYLLALAKVDVLLLNYSKQRYYFRSSGVLHEAACLGTAVVCPDFPVFRCQVSEPVWVGAVYGKTEEIVAAIQRALNIRRNQPGNFELWAKARSPQEFSRRIDRFIEGR